MKRIAELVLIIAMPLAVVIAALVRPVKGASHGRIGRSAWAIAVGPITECVAATPQKFVWPELHSALHERHPWGLPGIEPPLREMLSNPLIRAVMRSDGVPVAALKSLMTPSGAVRRARRHCANESAVVDHASLACGIIEMEVQP